MRHGSLFSGIGGFDLAAEWMGWDNMFHCELNTFCRKILKRHWSNTQLYEDITKTNFTQWGGLIDVLTGGFPCQPYSTAGKRKGKYDERHLWPEMLRAIREIRPRWIVGENVRGLISWNDGMVFDEVQTNLEDAGYEVFPVLLPAAGINAPHRRDRVWFIAYSDAIRRERQQQIRIQSNIKEQSPFTAVATGGFMANPDSKRWQEFNSAALPSETPICTGPLDKGWTDWPTEPPVCGRNDGIPHRVDRITALGNAIVPQVAYEIFKTIELYEILY